MASTNGRILDKNKSKKINVAILGCGRIASFHAKAITANKNLRLVGICDLNNKRINTMLKLYKANSYKNIHEMINNENIDVIAICTPSGMHFPHAYEIIKSYKLHVVIEKPIVLNLSQLNKLNLIRKSKKVFIAPIHQYRFNKCVQRVKKAIKNKELGKIFYATVRMRWCRDKRYYSRDPWRGTYSHDGGCTTNQGIHHLDLLRYFFGEAKEVFANMKNYNNPSIEVEDTVFALIKFKNNIFAQVEISTAVRPKDIVSSLSVIGSEGVAEIGGWATDKLTTFTPNDKETKKFSENFKSAYGHGHKIIYDAVYNKIKKKTKLAVEFEDTAETFKLLNAIYVSNEKNKWIKIKSNLSSKNLGKKNHKIDNIYKIA